MESAFQLKGKLFTLSVLQLQSINLSEIDTQLEAKIKLAPKFFNNTPVVIDLHEVDHFIDQINLDELTTILKKHTLIPVGFRGLSDKAQEMITSKGYPILNEARATAQPKSDHVTKAKRSDSGPEKLDVQPKQSTTPKAGAGNVLIQQQVRSGQQIYAPDGDLIILASVSPGAELLAEGNIHVYGTLRGRALAGLNGNTNARIFCQKLEADLVSIAGQYRVFEETPLSSEDSDKNRQIHLKDGQLVITTL